MPGKGTYDNKELVLEWSRRLAFYSVASKKPLSPATIDRYLQVLVGREVRRVNQPTLPLLDYWGEAFAGRPLHSATLSELLPWFTRQVRDGRGGMIPASESEGNTRRSATKNLFTWMALEKQLPVDLSILQYQPAYEDRASVRRRVVKLNPIGDGVFAALWARPMPVDVRLWIGMSAFMTMRIGEVANMKAWEVDLERGSATFTSKGGGPRTVHYAEVLVEDWSLLPHIDGLYDEWVKLFVANAELRRESWAADPEMRWFHASTVGATRPHRDDPTQVVHYASGADMNRFDKAWQKVLLTAGFELRAFHPHQLRHFAATNLWRSGAEWERIKEVMGHDPHTDTSVYVDLKPGFDAERKRNIRRRLERQLQRDDDDE